MKKLIPQSAGPAKLAASSSLLASLLILAACAFAAFATGLIVANMLIAIGLIGLVFTYHWIHTFNEKIWSERAEGRE